MAYIGNNLDSDIQVNKYEYTATAGQTTFACTYDRAVDVYLNGVKLDSSDFTATNGTAIVLASGANVGDIVDINAYFDVTYAGADAILPDQAGNSGKFLTTNGTNSSWGTVDLTDLNPTSLTIPNYSSDPASPSAGDVYYNTTEGVVKHYDGTQWLQMSNKFSATGGSIFISGAYKYHVFTSSGTFAAESSGTIDYLMVAGGGSGGNCSQNSGAGAGGGGAGGLLYGTGVTVTSGSYPVVIGSGGATKTSGGTGNNGSNTTFKGLTAIGGGGGGGDDQTYAGSGGSGGGATNADLPGSGTTGQGNRGGYTSNPGAGGGGGAGAVGASASGNNGGAGGIGLSYSTFASATSTGQSGYYAGGGGGAESTSDSYSPGAGGLGGGGIGSTWSGNNAAAGLVNTGGGGGGGSAADSSVGAAGGSGIVIIRYLA